MVRGHICVYVTMNNPVWEFAEHPAVHKNEEILSNEATKSNNLTPIKVSLSREREDTAIVAPVIREKNTPLQNHTVPVI